METPPSSATLPTPRQVIGHVDVGRVVFLALVVFGLFLLFLHEALIRTDWDHPVSILTSARGRRDFGPVLNFIVVALLFWMVQPYVYGALSRNGEQLIVENGVLVNGHPIFGAIPIKRVYYTYGDRRGFWGPPPFILLRDHRAGWRFVALFTIFYREPYDVLARRLLVLGVDVPEPDAARDLPPWDRE